MKKIKLRKFLKDSLNQKFRKGQGYRKEKGVHNETPYIHSTNTYRTYIPIYISAEHPRLSTIGKNHIQSSSNSSQNCSFYLL